MSKSDRDTAIFTAFDDFEHGVSDAEASLFRAILTTALTDLKKDGLEGRKAREYFLSDEEDYLFSFQSICGYLDLDPEQVLQSLGLEKHSSSA
jgi:hypothetical protein